MPFVCVDMGRSFLDSLARIAVPDYEPTDGAFTAGYQTGIFISFRR
jgi:hypothetical protein